MITGFRSEPTQDVDAMWEADAAAEWERINTPTEEEEALKEAALSMTEAEDHMAEAIDLMLDAIKAAEGTVAEDRIVSLMDGLEDLRIEIKFLADKVRKGQF